MVLLFGMSIVARQDTSGSRSVEVERVGWTHSWKASGVLPTKTVSL